MRDLIVDNFAGGGGASTGIHLATGLCVDIAINHDQAAIDMHKANHPETEHYQASVWGIDPVKVCGGRPVGLAWFSPDCKHFSKAKGGKPVEKSIRGLAWIVLRWAGAVRPRVIMLENVEEFRTWGPVRKGRPVKSKSGTTFERWKSQLESLGYAVEWRELVAADYGVPTTRKRFFLVARCDGRPIVWPVPTHAPRDSADVAAGRKLPWRAAAEIIDWTLPAPSIFESKADIKERYGLTAVRPLADNTLRRVVRGIDKFVIKSGTPYIVPIGYGARGGQAPRVHDIGEPLPTSVGGGKHYLSAPALIQYHQEQAEHVRGQGVDRPIMTVDAANRYGLAAASIVKYYGNDKHGQDIHDPAHTATAKDREGLTLAHLAKFYGGNYTGDGSVLGAPLHTTTAIDHNALVATHIAKMEDDNLGGPVSAPV